MSTPLRLIARLASMIDDCLKEFIAPDEPLAIVDFPDIRNCGDSAIWLGEIAYLANGHGKQPAYVSRMHDFSPEELERVMPEGTIFIHGGGNFGDIWPAHQDFRERVIERFPNRRIVQFPQSIHYQSQERAEKTARIIGRHKNFTLLVRDEESRAYAAKQFGCDVRLCPDMAFCMNPLQRIGAPVYPVLAMLRQDKEQGTRYDLSAFPGLKVEDWINESKFAVDLARAVAGASAAATLNAQKIRLSALNAVARARVGRGVRQLSRGRAIVTDRLHVHIFSLLLGLPHAVLDNNYGKVRRFMRSFSGQTTLTHEALSLADAVSWAEAQAGERSVPPMRDAARADG